MSFAKVKYRTYIEYRKGIENRTEASRVHYACYLIFFLFGQSSFSSTVLFTVISLSTFSLREPWINPAKHSKAASYSPPPPTPFFSCAFRLVPAGINHYNCCIWIVDCDPGLHMEVLWSFLVR